MLKKIESKWKDFSNKSEFIEKNQMEILELISMRTGIKK